MKRALLIGALLCSAALLAGFGGPANFGKEGAGFRRPTVTPIAACGTGVIDLSTGCSLPIALGLVS